nr:immunoglobulin light chain junction region [Macaca mulatta]MOY10056.1 immunoglobulin light chain junction region [Macaca mulatta]
DYYCLIWYNNGWLF